MHPLVAVASISIILSYANSLQQEHFERVNYQKFDHSDSSPATSSKQQQHHSPVTSNNSKSLTQGSELQDHQAHHSGSVHLQPVLRNTRVKPANNHEVQMNHKQQQQQQQIERDDYQLKIGSAPERENLHPLSRNNKQQLTSERFELTNQSQPPQSRQGAKNHAAAPYQQQQQQQAFFNLPVNLELALRQASGDESVFQPTASVGAPRHSAFDSWPPAAAPSGPDHVQAATPKRSVASDGGRSANLRTIPVGEHSISSDLAQVARQVTTPPQPTTTTATAAAAAAATTTTTTTTLAPAAVSRASRTTVPTSAGTTEISNSVSNQEIEPFVLSHQDLSLKQTDMASANRENEINSNAPNSNGQIEFSNQVIYEGPATAPPLPLPPTAPAIEDYYYTSTTATSSNNDQLGEQLGQKEGHQNRNGNNYNNNNERAASSNAWWAIGVGEEFKRVNNLSRDNYLEYCDKSALLINNKQRSLCKMHHRVMTIVARGIKMAIDECQTRFATSRWNCSLVVHEQRHNGPHPVPSKLPVAFHANKTTSGQQQIFGDVLGQPNRERSLLNALFAASIAHSMTKSCSQGEMPDECSCDRKIKSKNNNRGRIEWVACSDDIDYGARFSRDFTDNVGPNELDATATIYMHNNEVGRRVFKSATDITCTCLNGENGLCQTKRCWKHLGSFSDVVDEIIKRYESATHVQRSSKDPNKLRPVRRGVRKPKRKDLVYIVESPDYCQQDLRIGVLGTQNRACNSTSQGPDSCSLLCCGRGFQRVVEHIEEDCNCKFVWCCQVKCEKCSRFVTNDICN